MNDEELVFDEDSLQEYQHNSKNDKSLSEKIDSAKSNIDLVKSMRVKNNPKSEIKSNNSDIGKNLQKNKIENARKNNNFFTNKKNNKNSQLTNKLASNALSKAGIPKPASDALVNSKLGQKALEVAKKKNPALNALDKVGNALNKKTKEESDGGVESTTISLQQIKTVLIFLAPVFCLLIIFSFFIIAPQVYVKTLGLGISESLTGTDVEQRIDDEVTEAKIKEEMKKDDFLKNEENDEVAYLTLNNSFSNNKLINANLILTTIERPYQEADLSELTEFYGQSVFDINSNNSEYVYNFFFKLYDIYQRYERKYKVSLDLALLMSTLYVESNDVSVVFEKNAKDYNHNEMKSKLSDTSTIMELDYEYDWSNYKISRNDSSHDIEILAQHMISKDENGNYKVDDEAYREFLKEFIEKKYYLSEDESYKIETEIDNIPNADNNNNVHQEGEYWRNWKQCGNSWSNLIVPKSSSTMCKIGCLISSISIQIERSGVETVVPNFNPGVALDYFTFSDGGILSSLASVSNVAPNFKYVTEISVIGLDKTRVINAIKKYDKENYYMVLAVSLKNRSEVHHHVALDYIDYSNNKIYIIDTGRNVTDLFSTYKIYKVRIFKRVG